MTTSMPPPSCGALRRLVFAPSAKCVASGGGIRDPGVADLSSSMFIIRHRLPSGDVAEIAEARLVLAL